MNKNTAALSSLVIATMLLSAMVLAAPTLSISNLQLPTIFNVAFADDVTIDFETETLPNGQPAYKLAGSPTASIPGPAVIVEQGDTVTITGVDSDFSVVGLPGSSSGTSYTFEASTPGTYVYKDESSSLVGLYGAVIVRASDGSVQPYVVEGTGAITPATVADLDREFVLFMVGSTFWGQEISGGVQTPLWTNPTLHADLEDIVQFHVLSIGHGHTFHLHAHRWVDPGTNAIIDTKLMEEPSDTHAFTVQAGADVGPGHWQYHCHVFAHMEAGMHGVFHVGSTPDAHHNPTESEAGANPYAAVFGPASGPGLVTFEITDEPGRWFRSTRGAALEGITATQSLELAKPGDSVNFVMSDTNTVHTITSLIWPTGAANMPMDEVQSYKGGGIVQLIDPGLYVFTCKVHPYMFGAVVVDNPATAALDLGEHVDVGVPGNTIPTLSDLATRLLRTFWIATNPANWQDYDTATNPDLTWHINYPIDAVAVNLTGGVVVPLGPALSAIHGNDIDLEAPYNPLTAGVGEVWIDTQFEKVTGKSKPGTATAVNVTDWTVIRKVALPSINMNNPHNMWTDDTQTVIYQTEWFDNKLTTFNRSSGALASQTIVGEAPSHVMTRADNGDIHVALNGEEGVAEFKKILAPNQVDRIIAMQGFGQSPTHPHAHWMSHDGKRMVTPNVFTHDSTLYGFNANEIVNKQATGGLLPIATGAMPDSSKYYVANLLTSNLSVMDMNTGTLIKTINLLEDYDPIGGLSSPLDANGNGHVVIGALPIQTPVSPNGIYMVTANTLSATLTIVDTRNDTAVTTLFCDPGCHGVNFGAKQGGGYYAYVSSKFSNAMLVVDADPNNDGNLEDAAVVGRIVLTEGSSTAKDYTTVSEMPGMGGQGVLAIPNVYNGWVQAIPQSVLDNNGWVLTAEQRDPNLY